MAQRKSLLIGRFMLPAPLTGAAAQFVIHFARAGDVGDEVGLCRNGLPVVGTEHRNAGGAPRKQRSNSSANSAMRAASRTSPAGMKPGL